MGKSTRNFFSAASFLVILISAGWSCNKAGSALPTSVTYLTLINEATYSGAASVYLNDTLATQAGGLAPGSFSHKYGTIHPGYYGVKFATTNNDSLLSELPASNYDTLNFYTLILYNTPGGGSTQSVKIWDDFSTLATSSANYRFFNLSADQPRVDLYLNSAIVSSSRLTADNASNNLYNGFSPTAAGDYSISVKRAGTDSVIATTTQNVSMANGNAYTIFLSGTAGSSVNPLQINFLQATY